MPDWVFELVFILILILLNGLLSMSEIAIVTARKIRLQQLADRGDQKAQTALKLAADPNRFLSTVQVGITFIGVLTSVFGGARIADNLAAFLNQFPILVPYSQVIALSLVVIMITYFTLVLGELAPKRIALLRPEAIARSMAASMQTLSRIFNPFVRLLGASTSLILRILPVHSSGEPIVTDDDIKGMIEQGTQAGVFHESEQEMVAGIFRLSDLRLSYLMTPRTDVVWLDIEDPFDVTRRKIIDSGFARFPVARGSLDEWLGIVQAKDLLAQALNGQSIDLLTDMTQPLVVPESMLALKVLEMFKQSHIHTGFVIDEFGAFQGMVTIFDLLEAIVGEITEVGGMVAPGAIQREDGSWLVDGKLSIDEFKEIFGFEQLPDEDRGYYQTIAGFVITRIGRIPNVSDRFEWSGWFFEVMDMDGFRVDKVMVASKSADSPHREE
jgi:putative hemolysin